MAGASCPGEVQGSLQPRLHVVQELPATGFEVGHRAAADQQAVATFSGKADQLHEPAVDTGFQMDGRTYGSLSAIAKKITGVNWSGPRFFGLNGH